MTSKVFTKLLGLFVLLLVFHTLVMEILFRRFVGQAAGGTLRAIGREAFWSGLIALAIALPLAAWVASRISVRMQRIMDFAGRIADGDLAARLDNVGQDELSPMEAALNRTAERLGKDFAELESGRHELTVMLDSMQEAVVAVTAGGYVRWSNSVMQRIAGTQIRAGRPLVHAVRDPELLACIRGALEGRELCFGRASSLAPGRVFEINAAPLPSGGALVVLHDVTGIEAAQKSRREFVANVSHELRTPLTSIQGYVETLIESAGTSSETTREFLGIILKNASRMNRLTEDLLALASVESPDYKLSLQPARASALVKDAIDSLGGIVVDSGIKLQSGGAPDALVMADPDAMNQVFGNLIENSLKYAKDGKRIKVGARELGSEVEFTVEDFGPGIASEHLERIFERFYRVDKARSRESGGTGLGLAIVKHIVLAHGGRIWAESELGNGASFHFTLPLAQVAQPAHAAVV
ncbi:MAG TPA: ATP-binding protein [Solirubrobacteraceae bacterium]|jgi:two-component system phosphate regulon sensor histidine kinase PhoR